MDLIDTKLVCISTTLVHNVRKALYCFFGCFMLCFVGDKNTLRERVLMVIELSLNLDRTLAERKAVEG